jgi:hypothetical protein
VIRHVSSVSLLVVLYRVISVAVLLLLSLTSSWAGGGWYLMIPPADPPTRDGRSPVPLREWDQGRSFDTADSCELARRMEMDFRTRDVESRRKWVADVEKDPKLNDPRFVAGARRFLRAAELHQAQAGATLCIAADDPRLRGPK